MNTKIDRIDHNIVIELHKKFLSISEIVSECGISDHLVRKVLEIHRYKPYGTKVDRVDHNAVYEMYKNTNDAEVVCKNFNISVYILDIILKEHDGQRYTKTKIETLNHESVLKNYEELRDIDVVAKMYNVSITTIDKILKIHNVTRSKRLYPTDEEVINKYKECITIEKTCKALNLSDQTIRNILQRNSVKLLYYHKIEVGDVFGKLKVDEIVQIIKDGYSMRREYMCICECGSRKKYKSADLTQGERTDCGCVRKEKKEVELTRKKEEFLQKEEYKEISIIKNKEKKILLKKQTQQKIDDREKKWDEKRIKIGEKINMLTIIANESRPGEKIRTNDMVIVKCDCGKEKRLLGNNIRLNKSCGCQKNPLSQEVMSLFPNKKEYGLMYARLKNMKKRCYNIMSEQYINYGMRGITICDRWMEPKGQGFVNFCTDMGSRPSEKHSIDRINNDGNYEPSNCQWATVSQQNSNQRRSRKKSPPIPF